MSDAYTDIARDRERGKATQGFLRVLHNFLTAPTPELHAEVDRLAEESDRMPKGYFSGVSNVKAFVRDTLPLLGSVRF